MSPEKGNAVSDNLYIGIDLGTSRSAVAGSNRKRRWVDSYVGYPKDFIAQRVLGKRVLFGAEALDNRLSVDLVRPLEHGVIKSNTTRDQEAVRELIGHLVGLAEPREGQKIFAAIGVPAEALKVNKLAIREAITEYADTLMVVSEPFSVAYGLDQLNNAMIIDIGAGTVDFCIMHGAMPTEEDQRSIMTAGDYIDQRLHEMLSDKYPHSRFTMNTVRHFKEQYSFVGEPNGAIEVEMQLDSRFVKHDITNEIRHACESILPALTENAVDLISKFDPDFQEKVRSNIILAGGGSQIRGIAEALQSTFEAYWPCKVTTVKDPLFSGADGALALATDMPKEYWEDTPS
jgi:rod shape-determining protein MreB